jgi:membrane protein
MFQKFLTMQTAQLGRVSRFFVFQLKLWIHCVRQLGQNRSMQQAAALSYHTIFGIVPLAVVILMIFQLFPAYNEVGDKVRKIVYDQAHLSTIEYKTAEGKIVMLTEYLDSIVNQFLAGFNKGTVTILSGVLIIWAALGLLTTIEKTFNDIWRVPRGRNIVHRVVNYWAMLSLGPLLLGTAILMSTHFAFVSQIQKSVFSHIAPDIISYLIALAAFFACYMILPNTKISYRAGLWGAAVGALVFTIAKWGFRIYVIKYIPYNSLYGVIGLIPLSIFWIYISWIIVLFGLNLTYTTQHLKSLDEAEIAASIQIEENFIANDWTAISIVREISESSSSNKNPVTADYLCSKFSMPYEFCEKILNLLVENNIIAKTSEPKVGYVLLSDPENIKLSDISNAVCQAGYCKPAEESLRFNEIHKSQIENLSKISLKQLL